ncbi:MAG: DEAD/DEAH box helicase [candidate division WOR-3 bacterium]
MKFEDMNIQNEILLSLKDIGIYNPTTIQIESIPFIKQGFDLIGQSATGSGKTLAFGIPIVEMINKNNQTQAIILSPTRELALQISNELEKISKYKELKVTPIYGGVPIDRQIYELRKTEIVVGTPGRILDHLKRGSIRTDNVKFFVLDEADKMIDMGFIDDINLIERFLPKQRQTILFSATMPESLYRIRDSLTVNAKKVKAKTKVDENLLEQYYYDVDRKDKFSLLVHLLKDERPKKTIIFCNSRNEADSLSKNLFLNGIRVKSLHGGLSQNLRERIISDFHSNKVNVLVATDVAARGLDIKDVTHIFNYNVPNNPEDYVNRIGRTARAGNKGKAICLLSRDDHRYFQNIISKYSFEIKKSIPSRYNKLNYEKVFSTRKSYTKNSHRPVRRY